jgi:serine protease Do
MNNQLISSELNDLAEKVRLSTVYVREGRHGAGSGVVWRNDGTIVTNAHVVRSSIAKVEFSDGRTVDAKLIAKDPRRDLAALKVNDSNLTAAAIGDSDRLRVGEFVLAVGNPLGEKGVVTTGIIHNLKPRSPNILTDVRLAPGNSGGALANACGEVIGINTAIVNGLGLAIASKTVEQFLNSFYTQPKPYLGVTLQPVLAFWQNQPLYALKIILVEADSPAHLARLHPGDLLIGTKGKTWQTPDQLWQLLDRSHPNDWLLLDFLRDGKPMVANIVLCHKVFPTTAV